jgi:hypothetical protein
MDRLTDTSAASLLGSGPRPSRPPAIQGFQALVAACSRPGWQTRLRDRLVQAPGPFHGNTEGAAAFVASYRRAPATERAFLWLQFDLAQPGKQASAQDPGARLVDFARHPCARSASLDHLAAEVTRRMDAGGCTEVVHRIYDAAEGNHLSQKKYGPLLHGVAQGIVEARAGEGTAHVAERTRSFATLLLGSAVDPKTHWPCIHTGLTQLVDVCTGKAPPAAEAVDAVVSCLDEALAKDLDADRRQCLAELRQRFPWHAVAKLTGTVASRAPVVGQPEPQRPNPPVHPVSTSSPPPPGSGREIDSKHGFRPTREFASEYDAGSETEIDSEHQREPPSEGDPETDPDSDHAYGLDGRDALHERDPESEPDPGPDSASGSDADSERSDLRPRSDSKWQSDSDSDSADPVRVTVHSRPATAKPSSDTTPPRARTHRVPARQPPRQASAQARPESKQPAVPAVIPDPARPQAPPQPAAKPEPQNLHHLTPDLAKRLWAGVPAEFQPLRLPASDELEHHDAHFIGAYLASQAPDVKMMQIAKHMWTRSQGMKVSPAECLGRFYAGWVETRAPGARTLKVLQATEVSNTVFDNYKKLLAPRLRANDQAACARLDLQLVTCLNAVAQKLSADSGRIINDKLGKALRGHMRPEHVQRDFLEIVTSARSARSGAGPRRPEPPGRGSPGWHN